MTENKKESMGKLWASRIKVLLISGVLASIANMIYEWRTHAATIHMPWEVFPALLYMFIIVVVSCVIHDVIAKLLPIKVPVILYVALITTILSFPFAGWFAETMKTEFAKIGLLPLSARRSSPTPAFPRARISTPSKSRASRSSAPPSSRSSAPISARPSSPRSCCACLT